MVFNIGRSNASKKGKVMADYYDLDLYTRKLCSDAVVRSDNEPIAVFVPMLMAMY